MTTSPSPIRSREPAATTSTALLEPPDDGLGDLPPIYGTKPEIIGYRPRRRLKPDPAGKPKTRFFIPQSTYENGRMTSMEVVPEFPLPEVDPPAVGRFVEVRVGRKRRRFRRRANEGEYDLSVDDRDSGARIRAGTLSRQRSGRDSWPMRMQLLVSHNINGTIYPRGAVVAVRDDLWKERTATIDRKGCRQPQTAIGLEEGQEECPPDKLPPFNPEVPPVPAQRPARTSIPFAMW